MTYAIIQHGADQDEVVEEVSTKEIAFSKIEQMNKYLKATGQPQMWVVEMINGTSKQVYA